MKKLARAVRLGIALSCISSAVWGGEVGRAHTHFAVEPQELRSALNVWAEQAGMSVALASGQAGGVVTTPRVEGDLPPERALQMLLAGTGLTFTFVDSRSVAVHSASSPAKVRRVAMAGDESRTGPAEVERGQTKAAGGGDRITNDSSAKADEILTEVVVTGTHIRNAPPGASPISTYTRVDIERTGYLSTEDFVRSLPQNFGGGADKGTALSPNLEAGQNYSAGSSVNLRGLGSGATLVLLNGRRVAPSNNGMNVDIAAIPLSAIERVVVLADGASAIYGSDAIGGVVNFVLRRDFDGAETNLRYGDAFRSGATERSIGQTLGKSWGSGHVVATYEYYDQDRLQSTERPFSAQSSFPIDLYPKQKRNSGLLTIGQSIGRGVDVFLDAFYSERDVARLDYSDFPQNNFTDTSQYNLTGGANIPLVADWKVSVSETWSRNDLSLMSEFPAFDQTSLIDSTYNYLSTDIIADGTVADLPAGDLKLAIGGKYQAEKLERNSGAAKLDRNVSAAFAELRVPLVSGERAVSAVRELTLEIAGRYEQYNDFGSTFNPKYGIVYAPIEAVRFRSTWGTSFKAPLLRDRDLSQNSVGLLDVADPNSGGVIRTLTLLGNGPDLTEEKSRTFTFGVDFAPTEGFRVGLTYFDTSFSDRIAFPAGSPDVLLSDPNFGAYVIRRNSSNAEFDAEVASSIADALPRGGISFCFYANDDACPGDISAIGSIVDMRQTNLAETKVRGGDLSLQFSHPLPVGMLTSEASATYLGHFRQRAVEASSAIDLAGTYMNPPRFRTRGGIGWSVGSWGLHAALNYTGAYKFDNTQPRVSIASWTTTDIQVSFEGDESDASILRGVRASLTLENAFDRSPPHVNDLVGFGYDQGNASPLGRFAAFQVSKSWGSRH
jgi:iron complex outermembrane recepter protein